MSNRDAYIPEAVASVMKFLNMNYSENLLVSFRLPIYVFTSWFYINTVDFYSLLHFFLKQDDSIIFVLKK